MSYRDGCEAVPVNFYAPLLLDQRIATYRLTASSPHLPAESQKAGIH